MNNSTKIKPSRSIARIIAASALSTTLAAGAIPVAAFAAVSDDGSTTITSSAANLASTQTDITSATTFTFSDEGISVVEGKDTGYKINGTDLTINKSGTYVVKGSCADGTITVKKDTTGVVLVLDGLTLTSSTTAPICCNKKTEVEIVAYEGTTNTLTDAALNNDETYPEQEDIAENAVIKSKDGSQITLDGTGTLNIVSNGKNGIKNGSTTESEGTASLTIKDLTLNITANVNDAINAETTLNVESGTITISAADDAIHSDYYLNIGSTGSAGPTINIAKCYEGLEGATLIVNSGTINITADDDGLNAANSDLTDYEFALTINGGTLNVNAAGDGLDSNGTLTINGGTVSVYAAEQQDNSPLDADGTISINGGTVLGVGYSGMSEGISGTQSYVIFGNSGQGGQGGDQPSGQGGNQPGGQSSQGGDQPGGQGGQSGQQPGGQSGQSGQQPGGQSGQQPSGQGGSTTVGGTLLSKGTAFTVTDSTGNTLTSGTAVRDSNYVLYSSSAITEGSQYNLVSGSSTIATATAGQSGGGDQPSPQPSVQPTPSQDTATRLYGDTALDTMTATVKQGFADNSCSTVIVATLDGYWDALSAASLAGLNNCPILITDSNTLSAQTASEISRLGATNVIIAGGTEAVSSDVQAAIEELGCKVTRAAGENAIGTSLEIYNQGKESWGDTCIIATSAGYYDALSASSYAYANNAPIFLANEDGSLSEDVLAAIEEGGFTRAVIAGGTAVVSEETEAQLKALCGSTERCGGENCFETSVAFAKFCVSEGMTLSNVCFATGLDGYYDALTGAALAGSLNCPILLIDEDYEDTLTYLTSQQGVSKAYVFGGTAVIDDDLFNRISNAIRPQMPNGDGQGQPGDGQGQPGDPNSTAQ